MLTTDILRPFSTAITGVAFVTKQINKLSKKKKLFLQYNLYARMYVRPKVDSKTENHRKSNLKFS